ncbi:MAG: hypothetical protein V4484_10950 [Pseudomonadota bacterium]
MTSITLHYKKSATGEQIDPPIKGFRLQVFRWDGHRATREEECEALQQYSRDAVDRFKKVIATDGYGDNECLPGGFHVTVERADGLPLTLADIDVVVLQYKLMSMQDEIEDNGLDTIESINSPRLVQGAVAALAPAGLSAWFAAIQQLEPGTEPQVVRLADQSGAMLLLDAGLIEQFDESKSLYTVPRTVAYCSLEFNP